MKRDFDQAMLDLNGQPIRTGATVEGLTKVIQSVWNTLPDGCKIALNAAIEVECQKELTLGSVCIGALMGVYADEQGKLDDSTSLARVDLARKINQGGSQDIDPKQRDMIKPLVGKKYAGPLIRSLTAEMLEAEPKLESVPKGESV